MAFIEGRSFPGHLLGLPLELQLRVMEGLGGQGLCAVEASCRDLRRLVAGNSYLYQRALAEDFRHAVVAVPTASSWKAQYVETVIRVRFDSLEKHRRVCEALKLQLDELDELLGDADGVRKVLGAPELLMSEPSLVLAIVGDMEQVMLQQRWDASEDLARAESEVRALQTDMQALLARVPRCWWPSPLQAAAEDAPLP